MLESCKFSTFIKLYEDTNHKENNTILLELRVKFVAVGIYVGELSRIIIYGN